MRFGEVWWVEFDDLRPVVLVAEPEGEAIRVMLVVESAGIDIEGVAVELDVGSEEGLPFTGVLRVALPGPDFIPCTWEMTLRVDDLSERAGELSPEKLRDLQELLRQARPGSGDDRGGHAG